LALSLWAGIAGLGGSVWASVSLCQEGRIVLAETIDPGLSDSEKRLVCGDQNPAAADTDRLKFDNAWRDLPPAQAEFNLRTFLQERGYFHPHFLVKEGRMWVNAGSPTRVTALELVGAPDEVYPERRRKLIDQPMTPALLSATEKWVEKRVRSLGYPCPKLKTEGDPETGLVRVTVETGPLQDLNEVLERDLPGIRKGILRRYDAFEMGRPYNEDLLVVSENRITAQGLFQNIRFLGTCGPKDAAVKQSIVAGPPRVLALGIGFDTELLVRVKAVWKNTRLGGNASSVNLSAFASAKDQLVDFSVDWYHLPEPSRRFLRPLFQLNHENQEFFQTLTARGQFSFGTTYDSQVLGFKALVGPAYDRVHTIQGIGPVNSDFLSLEGQLQARSHAFEYFLTNPRTGWDTAITVDLNSRDIVSSVSAQRLSWNGRLLWNFRQFDPPLWVFGARFGLKTVVTGDGFDAIPPNFRQYLGGSTDLRGFGLLELPGPTGALSSAFVCLEARLVATFPIGLEPFLFLDLGALGARPFSLDAPLYRSPGLGLRWASPVGVIRGTVARGTAPGYPDHWQFYLSFGEEF
jgi:translocation and assembly module TamA